MFSLAFIPAVIALTAYYVFTADSVTEPVCIIGAGPAGLAAAGRLHAKGRDFILYEKQDHVGGKCQSVYDNGTFIPLGAFMYSATTYKETQAIIKSVGLDPVPFQSGEKWAFNWTSGDVTKIPSPPENFLLGLQHEFGRYVAWWQAEFAPYNQRTGYENGVPDDYMTGTAQWLDQNGYKALPLVFSKIITAYGYGDFRYVPIELYMLQYFTPDVAGLLLQVSSGRAVNIIDFQEVFRRYATSMFEDKIRLSTAVIGIDRSNSLPLVKYRNKDSRTVKTQTCASIIVAFPPTTKALRSTGIELTEAEESVFRHVRVNNYWSGAIRTNIPHGVTLTAQGRPPVAPPTGEGQPITIVKLHSTSNITNVGSWDAVNGKVSTSTALDKLKHTFSHMDDTSKLRASTPSPMDDEDIVAFKKVDYFPHVPVTVLKDGWYESFKGLQGSKKMYYASGLNMFELVEYAVRAGHDVVDKYL